MKEFFTVKKIVCIVIAVIFSLVSFFVISPHAEKAENYSENIQYLNDKELMVAGMATGATATSFLITSLPGDYGSPIATEFAELGGKLLIISTFIFLEKSLLPIFAMLTFRVLIPLICLLVVLRLFLHDSRFSNAALRIAILAIAINLVIPTSVFLSKKIEEVNQVSLENTKEMFNVETEEEEKEGKEYGDDWLENINIFFSNAAESISNGISGAVEGVTNTIKNLLSQLINNIAVLIVTTCVIPILVFMTFLWLLKVVLGINVPTMGQMNATVSSKIRGLREKRLNNRTDMDDEE